MSDATVRRPGFVWMFPAVVDRVQDGDSVICHVMVKPGEEEHGVNVRVDGINAIELNEPFGAEARDHLKTLLPAGAQVTIYSRKREKYGRMMGRITRLDDGLDAGQQMLLAKASDGTTPLARPYNP